MLLADMLASHAAAFHTKTPSYMDRERAIILCRKSCPKKSYGMTGQSVALFFFNANAVKKNYSHSVPILNCLINGVRPNAIPTCIQVLPNIGTVIVRQVATKGNIQMTMTHDWGRAGHHTIGAQESTKVKVSSSGQVSMFVHVMHAIET